MSIVNSSQIDNFLPHMIDVIRCKDSLNDLNLMWRILESSAKINCSSEASSLLPSMSKTRENFHSLEKELVLSLVNEEVSTVLNKMNTKAQYLIDILVRNLYERTADVGFLATDTDICNFVANSSKNKEEIRKRLQAYRNKYTVYDEIILLDTDGNVLVNIDETNNINTSSDPLIKETLLDDGYIETYRSTDLRPNQNQSLIYSKRIINSDTGDVNGVLCLCFNLNEEMNSIFNSHGDTSGRSILLLLDKSNNVIASSEPAWVNIGTKMPEKSEKESSIYLYRGREYLVSKLSSEGYQGYPGPIGWKGQVMTPIDIAFSGEKVEVLNSLDNNLSHGLISYAESLCPAVSKVKATTASIQTLVWNGQVMTAGEGESLIRLKNILDQISETGTRGNEILTHSINDLYETIIAANLKNTEFTSYLLIDLLDRNLYERANDCRWWALTNELREALSSKIVDDKTASKLTDILEYINKLYTVYTRIFIYDRNGVIVASTNSSNAGETIIGKQINHDSLSKVMQLKTEQDYYVSPFTPDSFYENSPTYIYHAAIRSNQNNMVVGGIGIVFDSTVEFSGMLEEAITTNSSYKAFYINRQGSIISSTDPAYPIGSILEIDKDLLKLPNGASTSQVVIHDNQYALLSCSVSNGYREFKVSDGYQEDVIAVVYHLLGEICENFRPKSDNSTIIKSTVSKSSSPEFAIFFIEDSLFAIEAPNIFEALPAKNISSITLGRSTERVGIIEVQEVNKKDYAWVYDLTFLLSGQPITIDDSSQVIIIDLNDQKVGFLVSALHSVAKFHENEVSPSPLSKETKKPLIKDLINVNNSNHLIQIIDLECLLQLLQNPFAPIELNLLNNSLVHN